MTKSFPDVEAIDVLLAYLPLLEDPKFRIYENEPDRMPGETNVIRIDGPSYSPPVSEFLRAAAAPAWNNTDYQRKNAGEMLVDPRNVAVASLQDIRALLTFCVRAERFCEGSWGERIESGSILSILRRLKELRQALA